MKKPDIGAIIAGIYRTVEDPDHWPGVLADIAGEIGGGNAIVCSAGVSPQQGGLWLLHDVDLASIASYADYYGGPDARRHNDDLYRTELCNNVMRPLKSEHLICFAQPVALTDFNPLIHVGVFTAPGRKPFGEETVRRLEMFRPHIRQALALTSLLEQRVRGGATQALLLAMADPALIIDRGFHVRAANAGGEKILSEGKPLFLRHRQLVRSRLTVPLATALEALFAGAQRGPLTIAGPPGAPILFNLMPVSLSGADALPWDHVMIVIRQTLPPPGLDLVALKAAYGLTGTELKIAVLMADGKPVNSLAETLAITRETARTHIKHILHKTGCHRQSELIRLLLGNFSRG